MANEYLKRRYRGRYETALTTRDLGSVLTKVLININARQQERPDLILAYWPQVVGPAIAPLTRAVSFYEGVLTIKVKNSTLHSLLSLEEKPRILAALRQKFPNVTLSDIAFKIG
ncbi:putative uncharacterized protein [Waddlia chondrophila 2032/99]|uniref:DUF721 domain-containing protein n=2 Tax=Waddlia chondrophila TaxID=71667 RepID=D6YW58_WADCW|nr:DUF721 domain-containing protein [Waddlia chondrophila]ADI38369.1 conserved hypothetical protein [Waddlia chondrophila WSU 86-1044]CCB91456.1 putative uncharacterized protein [Waddlia chondrophila 2032/99]